MAGDEDRPLPEAEAPLPGETPQQPWAEPEAVAVPRSDEPASPAPPPRPMMPTVLAGIGVVVIVLLLFDLYTQYNPPGKDALAAAVAETGALKSRVAALEAAAGAVPALDKRVGGLAADIETLKGAANNDHVAADIQAALAPLQAKTDDLSAKLADQGTKLADQGTKLADQGGRLAEQGGKIAEQAPKFADQGGKLADLSKAEEALTATVAALPKVDLAPLEGKVAALDKRIVPLEAYFEAPKATAQATEVRQNGSAAETRMAPLAVIAQGVRSAIEAGRPFPTEVQALATLGVDEPTLAPLRAVATTGAATRADLAASFAGVQDAVVVAAAPVETGTALDRILANATSVVKVNKTGAVPGDDAAAIAARIGDDVKRGDLAAASAAWDSLPPASKTRSAEWADRLKARLKADAAARAIEAKAVAALAAAP